MFFRPQKILALLLILVLWGAHLKANIYSFKSKRILIIFSHHLSYPLASRIQAQLFDNLQYFKYPYSIRTYEMDVLQNNDLNAIYQNMQGLSKDIKAGQYDIIVAFNDWAVEYILSQKDHIPKNTKIIFANIHKSNNLKIPSTTNYYTLHIDSLLKENIQFGNKLIPSAKELYVIVGTQDDSKYLMQELQAIQASKAYPNLKINILSGSEYSTKSLLAKIRKLKNTFIILGNWVNDDDENINSQQRLLDEIIFNAQVPVLVRHKIGFQYGATAGCVINEKELANVIAEKIKYFLVKNSPVQSYSTNMPKEYVVDYNKLKEFSLATDAIPSKIHIINSPQKVWEEYPLLWHVFLLNILFLLILSIIFISYRRKVGRMFSIFKELPLQILVCNKSGNIVFRQLETKADKNTQLATIKHIAEWHIFNKYPEFQVAFQDVMCNKKEKEFIFEISPTLVQHVILSPLSNQYYGEDVVLVYVKDHTDFYTTLQKLEEISGRLDFTLMSIGDAVIVLDKTQKVTLVNQMAEKLLETDKKVCINRNINDVFELENAKTLQRSNAIIEFAIKSKEVIKFSSDYLLVTKNNRKLRIDCSIAPILNSRGENSGAILVFRDISKEYEDRKLIDIRHIMMQTIANSLKIGYFNYDFLYQKATDIYMPSDKNIVLWNRNLQNDDILSTEEWIHSEDIATFNKYWNAVKFQKIDMAKFEYRAGHNNKYRHYHMNILAVNIDNQQRKCICIIQDITEFVENKKQYTETYSLLNNMLANFPNIVFAKNIDNEFKYIMANESFCRFINDDIQVCDILGKSDFDLFPMTLAEQFRNGDLSILQNGNKDLIYEELHHSRLGLRNYMTNKTLITLDDGSRVLLGIGTDITEIKNLKEQAETQKVILQTILDNIPLNIVAKDPDNSFRYTFINRQQEKDLNISSAEVVGKLDSDIELLTECSEQILQHDNDALLNNEVQYIDTFRDRFGQKIIFEKYKKMLFLPNNKRIVITFANNITAVKELEERQNLLIKNQQSMLQLENITNEILKSVVLEENYDEVIKNILFKLNSMLLSQNVVIFELNSENNLLIEKFSLSDNIFECDNLSAYQINTEHYWYNILMEHHDVIINNTDNMKNDLLLINEFFDVEKVKALLINGIWINNKLWGIMILEYEQPRNFQKQDIMILHTSSNLFSIINEREKRRKELMHSNFIRQQIFDHISIPMIMLDKNKKIVAYNVAALRLWGFDENSQLLEASCSDTFCKNCKFFSNGCLADSVFNQKQSCRNEMTMNGRNLMFYTDPLINSSGELLYVIESIIDITELNQFIENEKVVNSCLSILYKAESQEVAIREVLREIGVYLQLDWCYLNEFNNEADSFKNYATYSKDDTNFLFETNKTFKFSKYDYWYQQFLKNEIIQYKVGENNSFLYDFGNLSYFINTYKVKYFVALPIWIDGKIWGALGLFYKNENTILSDLNLKFLRSATHLIELIFERTKTHEQLVLALSESQAAVRAKSTFLATMSHEIRTPLNAVIGFSDLLIDNNNLNPKESMQYLKSINYAGQALLQLINDILDLSKLEAEQLKIVLQESNLEILCNEMHSIFSIFAKQKSIDFEMDYPSELPLLYLDMPRLRQVLFNIIGNAVKFTQTGKVSLKVEYQIKMNNLLDLKISIIDTGIGISEDFKNDIFKPFAQDKEVIIGTRNYEGSGLGLPISKRLVECMNGILSFESKSNCGSTFVVELKDIKYTSNDAIKEQENKVLLEWSQRDFEKILLIDSRFETLQDLRSIFEIMNKICASASNSEDALTLLKTYKPDLIFMSIDMPMINGQSMIELIRNEMGYQHLTIVAFTSNIDDIYKFSSGDYNEMILKPFSLYQINQTLKILKARKKSYKIHNS